MIAKLLIWSFFILIADQPLVFAAFKFGLPIRPLDFYVPIAVGLLIAGLRTDGAIGRLRGAALFFVSFAALVALGAMMYRGENIGPDFGALLLAASQRPTSIGYVVWPAVNLICAAGLFLLARDYRRTIVMAAFVALVLQAATMESDMWWPALFGDPNGRAGGLARNANGAALLAFTLASLTLRSCVASYAVMIACAAALFSQSKSGALLGAVTIIGFWFATKVSEIRWPSPVFSVLLAVTVAGTIWLSPVLHPSAEEISRRAALTDDGPNHLPVSTLDAPVSFSRRIEARAEIDGYRVKALTFYWAILKDNLDGLGTGFTNKFITGPHNEWLKLAVDQGIVAPILFFIMLGAVSWRAMKSRNPALIAITLISWMASLFSHTIFVEPLIPVALAIVIGSSDTELRSTATPHSVLSDSRRRWW